MPVPAIELLISKGASPLFLAKVELGILIFPVSGSWFSEWAEEMSHIQNKRDKDILGN